MSARELRKLKEAFAYLCSEMGYSVAGEKRFKQFGNMIVEYVSPVCPPIRIAKDRNYFSMEVGLGGEYFEIQLVYRFLFVDEIGPRDFEGKQGLDELVEFSKKALLVIKSRQREMRPEDISTFYRVHPVSSLAWR